MFCKLNSFIWHVVDGVVVRTGNAVVVNLIFTQGNYYFFCFGKIGKVLNLGIEWRKEYSFTKKVII